GERSVAVSRKDLGNDRFGTHDVDCKIGAVGKVVDAGRLVDEADIERERASPGVEGTDWNRKRSISRAIHDGTWHRRPGAWLEPWSARRSRNETRSLTI